MRSLARSIQASAAAVVLAALVACADPVPVAAPPDPPGPPAPPAAEAAVPRETAPDALTIVNGDPGVTSLRVVVGGRERVLAGLAPNETRAVPRAASAAPRR